MVFRNGENAIQAQGAQTYEMPSFCRTNLPASVGLRVVVAVVVVILLVLLLVCGFVCISDVDCNVYIVLFVSIYTLFDVDCDRDLL